MSHFSRMKTQLVEKDHVLKALGDLELLYELGPVWVSGYMGQRTRAEIKVRTKDPRYDIGLVRRGGHYELVADWWGIKEHRPESFLAKLSQRYAYHATVEQLTRQGFSLVEEERQKDGAIHLVLRRLG